jgi:uncharacterized membrane protein YedE/YeeE
MDKILQSLSSGEWWFSVVVVGVIVGVAGTFAVRGIDSFSSRMTGAWANRSKRVKEARTKMVDDLMRFRHRIPFTLSRRDTLLTEAVWSAVLGAMAIIMSALTAAYAVHSPSPQGYDVLRVITGIPAIGLMVLSFRLYFKSLDLTLVLIELGGRLDVEQIQKGE